MSVLNRALAVSALFVTFSPATARADVDSILTPFDAPPATAVELKNDSYNPAGASAMLQLGFITDERAGVWVKVPASVAKFKVDSFRVLFADGSLSTGSPTQAQFDVGVADAPQRGVPSAVQNVVQLTPGPYWNDIPVTGSDGQELCASGGQYVGAALRLPNDGAPSVFRDMDGVSAPRLNLIDAIPGGWNYSQLFGVSGDWILRVVGHAAAAGECP